MEYPDQTAVFAFDEAELPPQTQAGQEIWRNYFNEIGPKTEFGLQINDINDFSLDDEIALVQTIDIDDADGLALLDQEFVETEAEVPYEWQYWLHTPDEFPAPDESTAPPMESGWVDPVTDEVVP